MLKKEEFIFLVKRSVRFALVYRLPVYAFIFLLIVAPFRYRYAFARPEIVFVALCFSSLMAFVYLLNKATDHVEDTINERSGPIGTDAVRPTFVVAMLCLFVPLTYLVFVPQYLPLYGVVATAGFLYSYHITFKQRTYRLKKILFVKTLVTAITWSLIPVVVQSLVLHKQIFDAHAATNAAALFCLFFAFGILSDIRDIEGDRAAGVRTIANTWGVRTVQIVATVLLSAYSVLAAPHGFNWLFILGDSLAFVFVWTASPKRGAWFFYSYLLVGILLLFILGFLP